MSEQPWQDDLLDQLRSLLEPDQDVRALVLFGSWASPDIRDRFSDVDVWLVTAQNRMQRFFPTVGWMEPIGTIFAIERSVRERHGALRIVFDDMRRLDVVVVEEPTVERIDEWSGHPLRTPRVVVFSRSAAVDRAVAEVHEPVPLKTFTPQEFAAKGDAFWFVAQLAVHKVVRGDLLIASHLSLELSRHCMELAMLLRDRAAGARYHRHGAKTDAEVLARLTQADPGYTAMSIIDSVGQAGTLFDELASAWEPSYGRKLHLLQPLLDSARGAL
jgi:predicted nucleotidyltransferase